MPFPNLDGAVILSVTSAMFLFHNCPRIVFQDWDIRQLSMVVDIVDFRRRYADMPFLEILERACSLQPLRQVTLLFLRCSETISVLLFASLSSLLSMSSCAGDHFSC